MVNNRKVKLLLDKILRELESLKAFEIQSLNIKNRSALADFIIIASGNSSRHVNSIVTNLSCPSCNSYVLVYYPRDN